MNISLLRKRVLEAGVAVPAIALMSVAAPAFAQDASAAGAADTSADGTDATTSNAIVVTGSRIRQPELESTVPVTNFGSEQIYQRSTPNIGEALNELPQMRSTYSQSNPGLGIGIAGLNLLDLRGLGIQRTLVLVNGRRHVPSDIQGSASAVDINTIPTQLVERVDIVTGGNSAVYGSDAIAGVVNFVMKENYEGIDVRAGVGRADYGSGTNYFVSGVAGKNFDGGRGNIAGSLEYSRQGRVFASDVPWRRTSPGFLTVDTDTGVVGGNDNIPDAVFFSDPRTTSIARAGLVAFPQTTAKSTCGGTNLRGVPYNCEFLFTADGNLVPITGPSRTGTAAYSAYTGGNGETGQEGRQVSVYPFSERIVGSLMGHYEFSPALTAFFEAKYAKVESIGSNSGPAFDQGNCCTFGDARAQLRLDNPFLTGQARQVITQQLLASGQNNGILGAGPLDAADRAAIADGSYRFAIAKSFEDLGIRDEDANRETYRIVAGIRGDIGKNWSYELSGNYGRTNEDIAVLGNVNVQRLQLALDAGRDPATGQITCRAKFDPSAAYPSDDVDATGGASTLAGDISACVPYNPFGAPNNAAARNYIVSNAGSIGRLEQIDITGFVSGNTAGFFELPGGPIGLVVGGEYRQENAYFKADDVINSGLTFANALATFDPPKSTVKEAFGELELPIFRDRPFFEELTLTGAARVSDYNNAAGTVFAYNFGGRWSPVRDITFRANYGRAIRAPNYTETSAPLQQDFSPGFLDPCANSRINSGSATRQANCQADLGANLSNAAFQNKVAGVYSLEIQSGANPLLTAETSDSLTVGAVVQPRWVPGLAITVDYYDIKVNNVIESPSVQDIVNQCYDLPSLDNQFCALFDRFQGPGTGPGLEVPGEILVQSLIQGPVNFAKRMRRGIDVDISYSHRIAPETTLNSRLYYTHVLKASNFIDPSNPDFEDRILSEVGDPVDEFVFNADLTYRGVTFGYRGHYIGSMVHGNYEDYNGLNGQGPQNADRYDIKEYPEVLYHDFRIGYQVPNLKGSQHAEVYAGVDNVFDKHPPYDLDGLTEGSAIYDVWGRRFYLGVNFGF